MTGRRAATGPGKNIRRKRPPVARRASHSHKRAERPVRRGGAAGESRRRPQPTSDPAAGQRGRGSADRGSADRGSADRTCAVRGGVDREVRDPPTGEGMHRSRMSPTVEDRLRERGRHQRTQGASYVGVCRLIVRAVQPVASERRCLVSRSEEAESTLTRPRSPRAPPIFRRERSDPCGAGAGAGAGAGQKATNGPLRHADFARSLGARGRDGEGEVVGPDDQHRADRTAADHGRSAAAIRRRARLGSPAPPRIGA